MESELKSLQSKIMDLETKLCFTQNESEKQQFGKSPMRNNDALKSLADEVLSIKSARKQIQFEQSAGKNSDILSDINY